MSGGRKVRVPFIPLNIKNKDICVIGELLVDSDEEELFIKETDGSFTNIPTDDRILEITKIGIMRLLDGVDIQGDTLEKINNILIELEEFRSLHTDKNNISNLYNIIRKFRDYKKTDDILLDLLNTKVDIDGDKTLSEVNFDDGMLAKLNSIETGSNMYRHPIYTQCDIKENSVMSVNKKTGRVFLNRTDIPGMEDIHPRANNYSHPENQQCDYRPSVISVNNKYDKVILDKTDIGLPNIMNYKPSTLSDLEYKIPNSYATLGSVIEYIEKVMGFK